MATHDKDITLLNQLTTWLIDSEDGYHKAADVVVNATLSAALQGVAQRRQGLAIAFRNRVESLGGAPVEQGSALAAAHRVFMNLRSMVQSDKKAAVAEVERGERILAERFEAALDTPDVSAETIAFIREQVGLLSQERDRMASLSEMLAA